TSDAFVASLDITPLPTLALSPTSLSFTSTAIGTAAPTQNVTLTNNSSADISFTNATISGGVPAAANTDFAVAPTPSACLKIPAKGTCVFTVTYTPSIATTETANLVFTDGDSTSPQTVTLTGIVVAPVPLVISPASLSFTSTAIGTAAGAQTVTITNSNAIAIPFTSATIVAGAPLASATDFTATVAPACASVPANGSCTVSVNFTPSIATQETATLRLVDGSSTSPQSVALTGNVTATPPDFTISAAPASFSVARGATGTSTITVSSVGSFASAVTLTCAGAPVKSTCSISPSSVTPTSSTPATAALSLVTTRHGEVAPPVAMYFPPFVPRVVVPGFLALFAMLFFFVSDQRVRGRFAAATVVLFLVVLAGCGGNGGGGTPTGAVTLTVTGTAGSTTHTTTVSATVTN
ncbi:MAG TPA: choice-of-anchor D domain-containing protein, partial [Candidatus Dormibacteraeota bacterium]|nr:choice-of-anchor D domain-containing protein [Candidatus Dormibacteraeota bacterium]